MILTCYTYTRNLLSLIINSMKAIFIDVDNTLLDFDEYVRQTLENGFREFDIIKYEPYMYDIFSSINDELWHKIETKELDFETLKKIRFNLIFDKLSVKYDGIAFEKYFREQLNESVIEIDGALELLKELSSDYILCAASNGPHMQQVHRLTKAGMANYFSYIFVSERLGASKPSKQFYDAAFKELNNNRNNPIIPSECLAIGDSITSDIAGGCNYGMKTCYYNHRSKPVNDSRIDLYANNLLDIPKLITQLA